MIPTQLILTMGHYNEPIHYSLYCIGYTLWPLNKYWAIVIHLKYYQFTNIKLILMSTTCQCQQHLSLGVVKIVVALL